MMPGRDGFETCRRLRAMPGHEHVPVLMLTGLDDNASITRAFEAGATDFFVKSHQWSLLAGRLHYLLRASHTRLELERSKAKLARAQDLARMGSFDWRRADQRRGGGVRAVARGAAGVRPAAARACRCTSCCAWCREVERPSAWCACCATCCAQLGAGHRRAGDGARRPPAHRARRGRARVQRTGHCVGYTGIVQDVTDRRVAEDRIRHLANFDALTGLPNRRQLMWRAERALEQARRLATSGAADDRHRPLQGHQRHAWAMPRATTCWWRWRGACAPACATATR